MEGLKALKELALERLKEKHPSFPVHLIPQPKYNVKTANGLTKSIVDLILLNGGFAERISNTGRYLKGETVTDVIGISRTTTGKYITGTGTNGTADISAVIGGKSIKIEVKIGNDKMSEAQTKYKENIEKAGGIYYVAKDFESFYTWYEEIKKR